MVVFATKMTGRKLAAGALALCALILGAGRLIAGGMEPAVSVAAESGIACKLKTNADRVAFLRSYGWEVDETPVREQEVRIPEVFDAVYQSYNELQGRQGLDLTRYQGKKATLYVYAVRNDPSGEQGVTANLVLYRNRLIAADLSSAEADGFVRPVTERPAAQTEPE